VSTDREKRREARRRAAHRRTEPDAAPAGETALRSKPVRITIDLTPPAYRELTRWQTDAAEELDVAKLSLADIARAAFHALNRPDVREAVIAELRERRQ
jgi:hypothetical protein